MYIPHTASRLATAVLLLASTSAQTLQESISFGYSQNIAPNGQTIPNWKYVGEGHTPYLLSDRINLTPPVLGNTRGGLWAEKGLTIPEWTLDLSFRVSGPERGNGNMQVWLTKDTAPASSMKSLYTVDKGGSIRGFLNDGSIDFRTHHNVDGLAFGHCEYVYRNLGRMSKLSMKHDNQGLEVRIDDKLCFKSSMVSSKRSH
jgi:mannose-binding lectin 1